jgi:hypothetical protein
VVERKKMHFSDVDFARHCPPIDFYHTLREKLSYITPISYTIANQETTRLKFWGLNVAPKCKIKGKLYVKKEDLNYGQNEIRIQLHPSIKDENYVFKEVENLSNLALEENHISYRFTEFVEHVEDLGVMVLKWRCDRDPSLLPLKLTTQHDGQRRIYNLSFSKINRTRTLKNIQFMVFFNQSKLKNFKTSIGTVVAETQGHLLWNIPEMNRNTKKVQLELVGNWKEVYPLEIQFMSSGLKVRVLKMKDNMSGKLVRYVEV